MTAPLGSTGDNFAETRDPNPADQDRKVYGVDPSTVGDLLTLKDTDAATQAVKLFTDQLKRPDVRRELEHWRVNELRRQGYANVWLEKKEGLNQWQAFLPAGSEMQAPAFNKAADLCRKFPNVLYVDPPAPDPIPATSEEQDVEAAEFAERVLLEVQGEAHLGDLWLHRAAQDYACTYDRGYIHYDVDPQGEQQPLMILAAPTAVSAEAPFVGPDGQMVAPPYVLRYVTPTGAITDERAQAAMQWAPRLVGTAEKPHHVRYLPATATDIWDAEGVLLGKYVPISTIKARHPEFQPDDETLKQLTSFKPDSSRRLWPDGAPPNSAAIAPDDQLVFWVRVYVVACPRYPEGCMVEALGPNVLLARGPWVGERSDGTKELLDLPVTEVRQSPDGGLMTVLGPANEHRMAQFAYALQWVDDWNNRATFIPMTSNLRPEDLEERDQKYFQVAPNGAPTNEQVDPLPATVPVLIQMIDKDMDTMSNLQQAAQGVEDPSVKSGAHAREIRSATLVLLSGAQQWAERGYTRGCRIQLQLIAVHWKAPAQIGWIGEDGQYRQQYWTAADLRGTRDVRLKRGTLSLQSAEAKAQEAIYYSQQGINKATGVGIITPDELRDILQDRLGGRIGLTDNPVRQRVKRQIAAWQAGPPEGWQPPPPIPQAPTVIPGPMGPTVQPPGPPQPQAAPEAVAIFAPIPADQDPGAAQIRYHELLRAMSTMRYAGKPLEWRLAFDQAFEAARQAAGVATVAEQQAAQQQQAQQQAMAAAQPPQGRDATSTEAAPQPAPGF